MSIGTDRMRMLELNQATSSVVKQFKEMTSELIDACYNSSLDAGNEEKRCWNLAMTHYETACMWATKAATTVKIK